MITAARTQHRLIGALVCVLAVGVFTLASQAKCSQYRSGARSASYLSKATKMSGDRCQTSAAVAPRVVPQIRPVDVPAHVFVRTLDALAPQAVFLDSFRFRPPPARVS